MTPTGRKVISTARSWIGTPYHHQASIKGAGSDCLGLLRGVWRTLYGAEPETMPAYTMDWGEQDSVEILWQVADRHLIAKPQNAPAPGDVLLFRMCDGAIAKHLGIAARVQKNPSFIHAYTGHGVIESPLTKPWSRRIVARFQFPNIKG